MKNTLTAAPIKANIPSSIDGVTIYEKPSFVVQRKMNREIVCKDKSGKTIAEFNSMPSLAAYVSQNSGKAYLSTLKASVFAVIGSIATEVYPSGWNTTRKGN